MSDAPALSEFQNLLHEVFCNRLNKDAESIRRALLKDSRSKPYVEWIQSADPRALEVMFELIQKWNLGTKV
jgi:hypothetical protein